MQAQWREHGAARKIYEAQWEALRSDPAYQPAWESAFAHGAGGEVTWVVLTGDQLRGLEERLVLGGPDLSLDDVNGDLLPPQQAGDSVPDDVARSRESIGTPKVPRMAKPRREQPEKKAAAAVPAEQRVLRCSFRLALGSPTRPESGRSRAEPTSRTLERMRTSA